MRLFFFSLISLFILYAESCPGQCPGQDSVWNHIVSLRRMANLNTQEGIKNLLQYEKEIKKCNYQIDSVHSFLLLSIGIVYYKISDFDLAAQYTVQALNMIHGYRYNPPINKTNLIRYYYYLSIYYDSLKMPFQKKEAIDSCIHMELQENSDFKYTSFLLENNVRDLFFNGDFNLCTDRATLGETLIHKYYKFSDSMDHIIYFIYYKANALRLLKKFTEAEQFLESKRAEFLKSKNKDYIGIIYNLYGYLYESREDFNSAIRYFQKAFVFDQLSEKKEISAMVLNEVGLIYAEKLNQIEAGLKYYKKALAHAQIRTVANAKGSDAFYILGNIANVYVRTKKFDLAYIYYQRAFDSIKPGINEVDLSTDLRNLVNANTVEMVVKMVLDKAYAYMKQYEYDKSISALKQAVAIYRSADRLLDKIKEEQAEMQSRLFWQSNTHSLYEHAIEAAYIENNIHDAFYFFEKSRAVQLNNQLNQQNRISGSDMFKQAQFKRKILLLDRARDTTTVFSNEYINIQKERIMQKQALDLLEQTIKAYNPLFDHNSSDSSFITIGEIQKYLNHGKQELLEIFTGDSAVYSLFITKRQVYFNRIRKRDFDSTAAAYIAYVSNPSLLNSEYSRFIETASHLYKLVFQNFQVSDSRIIISPDKQIFPFEALVSNPGANQPGYFIQEHAVSYTYSARYLLTRFSSDTSLGPVSFLGFAPVHYSALFSLTALQGSDISLNRIGAYFSSMQNLITDKATKRSFQQQFSNSNIIQLYTHASDSSNRGEPVIYFADSALYLSDLIPENKPLTRLIVLSACETGVGKLYQGEGVFSFNRGFASLGIPTSITNLWAVDDHSTYQLTEIFYKYLAAGFSVDISLQKAKLEFIQKASKQKRLPYYWAAAIIVGKSDPLVPGENHVWREIWIILFLVGIAFLVWQKWGKRKKGYPISG